MDVRYINPFLEATTNVVKTMAFVELTPGKPYLKRDNVGLGDITGIIGLEGEAKGSLSVTLNFPLIKLIMKNMLGEDIAGLTDEAQDAVGELTNMISGDARRILGAEGINLKAAIPTIVAGKDHTIKHMVSGPTIVIPFEAPDDGQVCVEVSIQSDRQNVW